MEGGEKRHEIDSCYLGANAGTCVCAQQFCENTVQLARGFAGGYLIRPSFSIL